MEIYRSETLLLPFSGVSDATVSKTAITLSGSNDKFDEKISAAETQRGKKRLLITFLGIVM